MTTTAAGGRVAQVRWCPATRVMVGLTASWLVFVLAQHLLSGKWWPWLLPDLAPPIVYLFVPAALLAGNLLLAVRRRGPAGVVGRLLWAGAGLTLLLGAPNNGVNYAALLPQADRANVEPTIRIVSWNTGIWHRDDDRDEFFRFLRDFDADVYLLQEYLDWDDAVPDAGARQIDDSARLRYEFPGYTIVSRGELITLSRLPVGATPPVPPDGPHLRNEFMTVYEGAKTLRTDVVMDGRTVSLYNVHVSVQLSVARSPWTTGFYEYVDHRFTKRHTQLSGIAADVAHNPSAAIIAGDLNTTSAMADVDTLAAVATDALPANDDLYPTSWKTGGGQGWWRLDWAFSTPGVEVHDYDFVPTRLSDHAAQVLQVTVGSGS